MNILLIEEDDTIAQLLNYYLEHTWGASVKRLYNAHKWTIGSWTPDITLYDCNLDVSNSEAFEKLRKEHSLQHIVFTTANSYAQQYMNKYHYDFLLKKPFTLEELDDIIKLCIY